MKRGIAKRLERAERVVRARRSREGVTVLYTRDGAVFAVLGRLGESSLLEGLLAVMSEGVDVMASVPTHITRAEVERLVREGYVVDVIAPEAVAIPREWRFVCGRIFPA